MLVVETVVRIRREYAAGKPIKAIARDLKLSRKVVRKAVRAPEGAFSYITRQAVEDGLGIGVGPLPLLSIDVASCRLVTPLPHIQVGRTGYVALTASEVGSTGPVQAFLEWLAAEPAVSGPTNLEP